MFLKSFCFLVYWSRYIHYRYYFITYLLVACLFSILLRCVFRGASSLCWLLCPGSRRTHTCTLVEWFWGECNVYVRLHYNFFSPSFASSSNVYTYLTAHVPSTIVYRYCQIFSSSYSHLRLFTLERFFSPSRIIYFIPGPMLTQWWPMTRTLLPSDFIDSTYFRFARKISIEFPIREGEPHINFGCSEHTVRFCSLHWNYFFSFAKFEWE